jgi:hypothetical protein
VGARSAQRSDCHFRGEYAESATMLDQASMADYLRYSLYTLRTRSVGESQPFHRRLPSRRRVLAAKRSEDLGRRVWHPHDKRGTKVTESASTNFFYPERIQLTLAPDDLFIEATPAVSLLRCNTGRDSGQPAVDLTPDVVQVIALVMVGTRGEKAYASVVQRRLN